MLLYLPNSDRKIKLANVGRRLAAFAIDLSLLLAVVSIQDYYTVGSNENGLFLRPECTLHLLLGWLYFAGMESSSLQATLGKLLFGLQVTDLNGDRISFKCASMRYVGKVASVLLSVFSMLMLYLSGRRQSLHDRLSDTIVTSR